MTWGKSKINTMNSQYRVLLIVLAISALLILFLWLQPKVSEGLAPKLIRAWVAVELEGSGEAVVGSAEVELGHPFTLHAVLEAEGRGGRKIYYTEAAKLRLPSGEVAAESLRPWGRKRLVKVRWFTVESRKPQVTLEAGQDPWEALQFEEILRPDWPVAWSVPGEIKPARKGPGSAASGVPGFGTQRFHARIEFYASEDSLVPNQRIRSWGAAELITEVADFPTLTVSLPSFLAPASRVFGLPQVVSSSGASAEQQDAIGDLVARGLAFTRLTVIRDQIKVSGRRFGDLDWRWVELSGSEPWGAGTQAGDLLQVGERLVVLYEDRGDLGVLDYGDLCFDFVDGAAVRPLGEVFSGEGQVVRKASLG